jgi:colanic acid biosynthesis glycosyl transferase WcaI
MPEPRVLFVNRLYWPSGAATAQLLADLAEGLAAAGRDVHVIAAGEASTRHQGVTVHRTGTPEAHGGLLSRAWNHRRFLRAARRLLEQQVRPGDTVVALTDPPQLGPLVAEVAAARGARVIHWIQDIYPEIAAVHFGGSVRWLLGPLERRRDAAWRQADACVTLGGDMGRFVASREVDPDRIQLVPNWAPHELDRPAAAADVAQRRAAWGCADQFVVCYSGNLGRVHEFATVLGAAGLLRDEPGIRFLFIGRGPRYVEVAAEVRRLGLPNVQLLPPEPRAGLAVSLAAADAHLVTLQPAYGTLVYPSKLAGVLAAGRPVLFVGPELGDIARLLREQDCGASFAPGAEAALAATIRLWQADPALRARLGSKARAAYAGRFDRATALARWESLLAVRAESP